MIKMDSVHAQQKCTSVQAMTNIHSSPSVTSNIITACIGYLCFSDRAFV